MLTRIKLHNFQRHENLEVALREGLTAIRAANEAGKSTLLRAICYALFGTKGVSETLDNLVTWGKPVNSLKVELDFTVDGVSYSMVRGKSGAELNYDGGTVTGQVETTRFICEVLSVDAGTAPKLILANQGEIRGALTGGAKATTELIEKMAELGHLDELIELLQARLVTGSTVAAEQAIASAQEALDSLAAGTQPDFTDLDQAVAMASAEAAQTERCLGDATEQLKAERAKLQAGHATASTRDRLLARQQERHQRVNDTLKAVMALPAEPGLPADHVALRASRVAQVSELRRTEQVYSLFQRFKGTKGPDNVYEGVPAQLDAHIKAAADGARAALDLQQQHSRDHLLAEAALHHGSCTFCGKDFSAVPEVIERNRVHAEKAANSQALASQAAARAKELQADCTLHQEHRSKSQALIQLASQLAEHAQVAVGTFTVPPTASWVGSEPTNLAADMRGLEEQITDLDGAVRAHEQWRQNLQRAEQAVLEAKAAKDSVDAEVAALPPAPAIADLQAAVTAWEAKVFEATQSHNRTRETFRNAEQERNRIKGEWQHAQRMREAAELQLQQRRAELKVLAFNNELMKRVKAARPLIADRLWALVLGAVSRYFSEMRGVPSSVTKSSDGFKVDGHVASTLSGSTLDVLGLAIRVALVRTFMPQAGLLVLDEPTAAMDDERTANLLGFLATTGFRQTIVVSHEDATESVADNLITL